MIKKKVSESKPRQHSAEFPYKKGRQKLDRIWKGT